MGRAPCCEKVGLKRGRWTAEEDELLVKYIAANGEGSWRSLPKNAGLLRCGKSCRLRWINYLRTDLKRGNITKEEEGIIVKLHASLGNRWSLIAGNLQGRTDNEIKNYWNSHLSRRIHTIRSGEEAPAVALDLDASGKRRGGRTSRSAATKSSGATTAASNTGRDQPNKRRSLPTSSSIRSDEGSSTLLDVAIQHHKDSPGKDEGILGGVNKNEGETEPAGGSSPTRMVGPWASEDSVECESNEEREGGAMSSSEKTSEDAALVLMNGENKMDDHGSLGSMEFDHGPLSDSLKSILDWDLEGMAFKLWDDAGDQVWGSGDGRELMKIQGMEGNSSREEELGSWLLSDLL